MENITWCKELVHIYQAVYSALADYVSKIGFELWGTRYGGQDIIHHGPKCSQIEKSVTIVNRYIETTKISVANSMASELCHVLKWRENDTHVQFSIFDT